MIRQSDSTRGGELTGNAQAGPSSAPAASSTVPAVTVTERRTQAATKSRHVDVDIVVPVHNEAAQIEASVRVLRTFLDRSFPLTANITIADNASTDGTWAKAVTLASELGGVRAVHIDQKGRGRALRTAWLASDADVVAYLDVDLSTGLDALLPLVAPLVSGHSDVAIGTRLAPGSRVVRRPVREVVSRGYNALLHVALRGRFSDAQCGFKALRRDVALDLVPRVVDQSWFFDTELLILAQRDGLRIHEVPVDWVDDPDSRVDVARTIRDDLRGVWRLLAHPARAVAHDGPTTRAFDGQATATELLRFAGIGVLSTVAYLALFVAFWNVLAPQVANALAVVLCGVANTVAHRRLAFSSAGQSTRRHRAVGMVLLVAISLGFSAAALAVVQAAGAGSLAAALIAVTVATALAALVRFWLLRTWVFRPHFQSVSLFDEHAGPAPVVVVASTDAPQRNP
jgi:putative flippase GtrA